MKITAFLLVVSITAVLAQRRSQKSDEQDLESPASQRTFTSRGRARFLKTPEFEKVVDDYEKAAKETPRKRVEATRRVSSKPSHSIDRRYEVEESVDDIPDSRHFGKPRVITETKFEAINAPKTKLFEPAPVVGDPISPEELIKSLGNLDDQNNAAAKLDVVESSSEGKEKEISPTTEKDSITSTEQMSINEAGKELKKERKHPTTEQSSTTRNDVRRTQVRTRTRSGSSTTEAVSQRTRTRSRPTKKYDTVESSTSTGGDAGVTRSQFRVGRRRLGQEQETLRGRGPSIIENHEELPGRSRSGRRVNTSSRRKEADTTTTTTTESSRAKRIEAARRSRTRRPDVSSEAPKEIERTPRRRTNYRNEESTTRKEATTGTTNARNVRGRSRFSYTPTADETKLEVLPLFERESRPFARNPSRTRGRARALPVEELVASSTVENPIRALPDSSTSRTVQVARRVESGNRIRADSKQRVKETVQSEVSEVVSTRKVTRRKKIEATTRKFTTPKGVEATPSEAIEEATTKKTHVTVKVDEPTITISEVISRGKKKSEVQLNRKNKEFGDENIDELNYPPQFKAIILAKNKEGKPKKGSRPDVNSVTAKSSTIFAQERVVPGVGHVFTPTTTPLSSASSSDAPTATASHPSTSTTTTTTTSPPPSSSTGALLTISSTPSLNVQETDNELFPKATRPPRRRFSVSTKTPQRSQTPELRKAPTQAPRKQVVRSTVFPSGPEKITIPTKQLKFHARFSSSETPPRNQDVEKTTAGGSSKRTYPVKPSRVPYSRKATKPTNKSFEERKIPRTSKAFESSAIPAQVVQAFPPKKATRYSSRYRSESRSSTLVPAYLPTVPTVTPSNQVIPGVHTEETNGYQIISIEDPVNSIYSDNLVSDNQSNEATVQPNGTKQVSIIERIINSITSISTTPKPVTTSTEAASSAILKIATKKPKPVESSTKPVVVVPTTDKPTTIIERILNSLSAIQASDHVGTTHPIAPAMSTSFAQPTTPIPAGGSNIVELLGLLQQARTQPTTKFSVVTPKIAAYTVSPLENEVAREVTTPLSPRISSTTRKLSTAPFSTVAISLADYLASLGIGSQVKTTTVMSKAASSASLVVAPSTTTEMATILPAITTVNTDSTTPAVMTMTATPTMTITRVPVTTNTVTNSMITEGVTIPMTTESGSTMFVGDTEFVTTSLPSTMNDFVTTNFPSTTQSTQTNSPTKITIDLSTLGEVPTTTDPTSTPPTTIQPLTEPFQVSLNSVTVISPNDGNNEVDPTAVTITSRAPSTTNSNPSSRSGKLLLGSSVEEQVSNDIGLSTTPRSRDYFIFAVLPNNTIVRKRPPTAVNAPYLVVGVYPNNTIVHKYPNGTTVPEEPVVQDTKNVVDIQANQLSLDGGGGGSGGTTAPTANATPATTAGTTTPAATTTAAASTATPADAKVAAAGASPAPNTNNAETNLTTLTELLGGKTAEEFKNIVNQSIPANSTASSGGSTVRTNDSDKENEINGTVTTTAPQTVTESATTRMDVRTTTVAATTTLSPTIRYTSTPISITTTSAPLTTRASFVTTTMSPIVRYTSTPTSITTIPPPMTATNAPFVTTDLSSFIASFLSTLRPVYTPTTIVPTTITTDVPTTFQETTTVRPTTTNRPTTNRPITNPPTTNRPITNRPTTTRPITTTISNAKLLARGTFPTPIDNSIDDETTSQTTVTITARRRTTAVPYPTTTIRQVRRTTQAPTTTTTVPVRRKAITFPTPTNPITFIPTTFRSTTQDSTTTINPADVDIDELLKSSNRKLTESQRQDLEAIRALEKEQAALLEQLAFLTNFNIGQTTKAPAVNGGNGLANRILAFAMERNKDGTTLNPTTTEPIVTIVQAVPSVTARQPKRVVIDDKETTLEDLLKQLNADNQNSITDPSATTYGRSQEAIIAAILKERGIEPSTPKSLGDKIRQNNLFNEPTTTTSTTRRPRTTTTQRPPGRLMQSLNWLLNAIAPPPTTRKPRPKTTRRPKPITTTIPTTVTEFEEFVFEPTESSFQTTRPPRRPVNALNDNELQNLIAQLEAIQKDPKKIQNLDLGPIKKLQGTSTGRTINTKDVEIISSGTSGSKKVTRAPKILQEEVVPVKNRGRQAKSTTVSPVSVSNSIEDDDEYVTNPRFRVTTDRATTGGRVTLPPVQLNPVPGVNEGGSLIGGQFLNAAVNVTRAISTFLGSAIQGAAQSFQSMIGSGSRGVGSYFSSSSTQG